MKAKMALAFSVTFLLVAWLGSSTLMGLSAMQLGTVTGDAVPSLTVMSRMRGSNNANFLRLARVVDAQDPASVTQLIEEIDQAAKANNKLYEGYVVSNEEDQRRFDAVLRARKHWGQTRREIVALAAKGQREEARARFTMQGVAAFRGMSESLDALSALNESLADQATGALIREEQSMRRTSMALLIAALMLTGAIAVLLLRAFARPIAAITAHIGRIAAGDFGSRCQHETRDEFGAIARAMDDMAQQVGAAQNAERLAREEEARRRSDLEGRIARALTVVQSAGQGDLTCRVGAAGEDALAQLTAGIDQLVDELASTMVLLARNADQIAGASSQLTATAQEMANRSGETERQSAEAGDLVARISRNIESVAAATEEMSASIKEISRNAQNATQVASGAVKKAASA